MQQTEKNATKLLKCHGAFDHRKDAEKSLEAHEQLWKSLGECEELGVCGGKKPTKPKPPITTTTPKPIAAPMRATTFGIAVITGAQLIAIIDDDPSWRVPPPKPPKVEVVGGRGI
ncbi:hypothetical protein [Nostoc commune]|uniref:hypothetical protein n=1 Tax=Nostoc commune TaxID=1178 RepID=UPI0018C51BB8|nr:hypothetical protein [Nostoc commune]MBG1260723.1 hypothetical protein [Nostoc commune BAE]